MTASTFPPGTYIKFMVGEHPTNPYGCDISYGLAARSAAAALLLQNHTLKEFTLLQRNGLGIAFIFDMNRTKLIIIISGAIMIGMRSMQRGGG